MQVYYSYLKFSLSRSNCTSYTFNTSGITVSHDYYVSPVKVACSTQPCPDVRSVIETLANTDGIKMAQLNIRSLLPKRDQIEILRHPKMRMWEKWTSFLEHDKLASEFLERNDLNRRILVGCGFKLSII